MSRGGRRRNLRRGGAVRAVLRRVTERHCDVGDRSDRASRCWLVPSRATTNLEVLMT